MKKDIGFKLDEVVETRKRKYNNTGTECKNHCVSSVGRGVGGCSRRWFKAQRGKKVFNFSSWGTVESKGFLPDSAYFSLHYK